MCSSDLLVTQRNLAEWVTNALQLLRGKITDPLPASICMRHKFMPLEEALYKIHIPQNSEEIAAARARMKYEELFFLQLEILRYAQIKKEERGFYLPRVGEKFNTFYTNYLPFPFTQTHVHLVSDAIQPSHPLSSPSPLASSPRANPRGRLRSPS